MLTAKSSLAHYSLYWFSSQPEAVGRLQQWVHLIDRRKAESFKTTTCTRGIFLAVTILEIDHPLSNRFFFFNAVHYLSQLFGAVLLISNFSWIFYFQLGLNMLDKAKFWVNLLSWGGCIFFYIFLFLLSKWTLQFGFFFFSNWILKIYILMCNSWLFRVRQ